MDPVEAVNFILETYDFRPDATKVILVFGAEETEVCFTTLFWPLSKSYQKRIII